MMMSTLCPPRLAPLFAAASMLALAACATPTGPEAARSFDRYEAAAGTATDFSRFDRVYITPVEAGEEVASRVDYRARSRFDDRRPLTQRELDIKLADLGKDLADALGEANSLVDAPGPGILTVAATVTELDSNRPTQAELSQNPGLDFRSISIGGAAVTVILSEDGAILATIEDEARDANLNDPSVGAAKWSEVNRFFDSFSRRLAGLIG